MYANSKKYKALTKDKKSLIRYYTKNQNLGKKLTHNDLMKYVKSRNLDVDTKFVAQIRKKVFATALFTRPKPVNVFQTVTVAKLGLCSMDFAYFKNEWKRHNNGYIGFLMINSVFPKKRCAIPMKSRNTIAFEKAIEEVCLGNVFPAINTILSDRETTIYSKNFQNQMKKKYSIKFNFIQRFNKAWSSEVAIRYTKEQLSIALMSKGGKRWVDILPEIIASHNRKKIDGTDFSPNDINDSNFEKYINQLKKTNDATLFFNTNSIDHRSILSEMWKDQIFEYEINDKVLVTRQSLKGRKVFSKTSVEGTYESTPFYIHGIKLRQTIQDSLVRGKYTIFFLFFFNFFNFFFFFFSVYKIRDQEGNVQPGYFDSNHLIPYPPY